MRYIRYAIYAAITVVLVTLALANLDTVTLNTMPQGMAGLPMSGMMDYTVQLPLFIVILGSLVVGFVLGEVFEWLREWGIRSEAARKAAEVKTLQRELKKTQAERDKDKDEVLALLDQSS